MTDDPRWPAADSGDPAATFGGEPVVDPAVPDPGSDRVNVVYLVPTMSGPSDSADAGGGSSRASMFPAGPAEPPGPAGPADPAGPAGPAEPAEREDWAWVQEWRAGQEPTPWATGVALAVFSALVVGIAVWVLSAGLADRPVIAVLVNLLVAGGLTPAIWLSRGLPVLRWIAAGAAAGIVIGWVSAILMLPLPTA